MNSKLRIGFCGAIAGMVNGIFGAGGGMVLVPLLQHLADTDPQELFPSSISIILPISLVSLLIKASQYGFSLGIALPYLLGSIPGGLLAGKYAEKIPVSWLHRLLGILILWGGFRYLTS